jgi:hypothetical protein
MLYYNIVTGRTDTPDTPVEAYAGMKWLRSNIRRVSRLALFALAIQFVLSFGHFHSDSAQAAFADANQAALQKTVRFATSYLNALDRASHQKASGLARSKTASDHLPNGQPTDDCAICAVMALASAMVVAAPPCLPGPQAAAFQYLTADAGFVDLNSVRVAFQPRGPPVS